MEDVRVALLASLTAAHSMLKDAHQRKVPPSHTMGSDRMFLDMLDSMEKTMARAREDIWPKPEGEAADQHRSGSDS